MSGESWLRDLSSAALTWIEFRVVELSAGSGPLSGVVGIARSANALMEHKARFTATASRVLFMRSQIPTNPINVMIYCIINRRHVPAESHARQGRNPFASSNQPSQGATLTCSNVYAEPATSFAVLRACSTPLTP